MYADIYTIDFIYGMSLTVFVLLIAERRNNFPPLPGWFPIKPCFYQDFDVEIPVEFQHLVRSMYRVWQGEYCQNSANHSLNTILLHLLVCNAAVNSSVQLRLWDVELS